MAAGGLTLAGRLLPSFPEAKREDRRVVEIAMRASADGARVWFDPVGLLVRPGTTVRWVLVEGVHTTTAYHPANGDLPRRIPEGARPWDSGYLVEAGASFEARLAIPGVYDFFCRPHEAAGMVGRVVVAAAGAEGPERAPRPGPSRGGYGDEGLPRAAVEAFPAVAEIRRRGLVRMGTG